MELTDYVFSLQGGGHDPASDPKSIGARFLDTLNALNRIDPIFSNWVLTDNVKLELVELASVSGQIGAFVENNVARDDYGDVDPEAGYRMAAYNARAGGPRTVTFRLTAGRGTDDLPGLSFGDRRYGVDASLLSYPLFKASLLTLVANWRCAWVTATGFALKLRHVPEGPAIRVEAESFHRLTWLAYLSPERAAGLALPHDLVTERTEGGGLLMIAAEECPDPHNTAQMERANLLTAIMQERGRYPCI